MAMSLEVTTRSPSETEAVGAALKAAVRAGDVILLVGPLGAGKTTLVKGLARALGYEGDVTSPTFTLSHVYQGSPPLVHADLWRLERVAEIEQLALDEEIEEGGAALVVEWGEAAEPLFGDRALVVAFEAIDEGTRRLRFMATAQWQGRLQSLEKSLDALGATNR